MVLYSVVYPISSGHVIHSTAGTPINQRVPRRTARGGSLTGHGQLEHEGACLMEGILLPPDAHPGGGSVLADSRTLFPSSSDLL